MIKWLFSGLKHKRWMLKAKWIFLGGFVWLPVYFLLVPITLEALKF